MKRFLAILSVSLVLLAVIGYADSKQANDEQDELTQLKQRIESLERRVAELEKQRMKIQTQPKIIMPERLPPLQDVPGSWEKREFNGISYYIIPIDQKQEVETEMRKVKP